MGKNIRQKNLSAGFGVIEALIIVIALVAIGFVGWKVLSKNKPAANSSAPSPTNTTQTQSPPTGKITSIDTSKLKFDQAGVSTDPIGDKNGPFYHEVYTATSTDGVNFTATGTQLIAHTSVPDAIKLPSGQLVFYAVDGAQRSRSGVLIGVSGDNGKTWKFGSLHISGVMGMADPQITMADNGQLRIYYTVLSGGPGAPNPAQSTTPNKIDSAVSSDGINFTKESGDRFSMVQGTDPDIIKIGNTWFMYVSQGPTEIYATSSTANGTFTQKGTIATDGDVSKTVKQGSLYRQFYCNQQGGISSRTSTDGITWSGTTPALSVSGKTICDPSPVEISPNNWVMVYKQVN